VSSDAQDSSNQVPGIERFAAHHGYPITRRYQVSESAWDVADGGGYQDTLQRALDDAYRGQFKILIVWALDRLTRGGAEDMLRLIRRFRERGCIIVSIQEPWLNGSPEIQDVLLAFAGWMAQQESARRSERVKAGMARARDVDGKVIGGRKPGARDKRRGARERRSQAVTAAWAGPGGEERRRALAERNRARSRAA